MHGVYRTPAGHLFVHYPEIRKVIQNKNHWVKWARRYIKLQPSLPDSTPKNSWQTGGVPINDRERRPA